MLQYSTYGLCIVFENQTVGAGNQAHHWSECVSVGGDVWPSVLWGPTVWCAQRLHHPRALTALHFGLQRFRLDAII